VPTKTTGRDAARKSPVQDYKRGETRFVISLVAMLALPGLAIAAVDRSPWAEFDTIIVGASQTGCELH
jgi:hypothetical protein